MTRRAPLLLLLLALGVAALTWVAVARSSPGVLGGLGARDGAQLVGSSYAEGPHGCSDLFRILGRTRGRVERWTRPLTQLPPGGTLVVFTPATTLHPEEQHQLLLHAEAGGTVLLVAEQLPELLERRGLELRQVPLPASSRPQLPSPLVDPAAPLESRGMALLAPGPGVLSLYGSSHGARVASVGVGQGRLLLVTDPWVLSNEGIRRDGNLRLAWRLANALPEPVRFDERHHGFEPSRGVLSYARARRLQPALGLAALMVLLVLWRLGTQPLPTPPRLRPRPAGPAALIPPLAGALSSQRPPRSARDLIEAELRRRGRAAPSERATDDSLLERARGLHNPPLP